MVVVVAVTFALLYVESRRYRWKRETWEYQDEIADLYHRAGEIAQEQIRTVDEKNDVSVGRWTRCMLRRGSGMSFQNF